MLHRKGRGGMTRALALAVVACLAATLAATGLRAGPAELWDSLRLDELVEVMAEEGRDYGDDLAEQTFERGGGPTWAARVADLYDPEEMIAEVKPLFLQSFEDVDTAELEAFFSSDPGQRIVEHEIEARQAFLDPEVEAAAAERVETLREIDRERYRLIGRFIEVNDLVESNVASSLTFSYAFNLGLVDGEMDGMTEADALTDAWAQEDAIREDTREWLYSQLSLAFAPLTDEEVRRYVEISETEAGETLNAALFQAFEPAFTRIARGLGEAVARSIGGRDI